MHVSPQPLQTFTGALFVGPSTVESALPACSTVPGSTTLGETSSTKAQSVNQFNLSGHQCSTSADTAHGDSSGSDALTVSPALRALLAAWHSTSADLGKTGGVVGSNRDQQSTRAHLKEQLESTPVPSSGALLWAVKNLWFGDDKDMTELAYLVWPPSVYGVTAHSSFISIAC